MFVVTLTYTAELTAVDAALEDHVGWLKQCYATGTLLAAGRRVPRTGGVLLMPSMPREALDRLLEEDPFRQRGLASYDVVEFEATSVAPGLEALRI